MSDLIGEITLEQLDSPDHHWFRSGYLLTKLDDPELLAKAKAGLSGVEIVIFFGTWCGDTRDYLPEFIRILDEAKLPRSRIKLYAMSKDKAPTELSSRHQISRLPTFIALKGGVELGRITEAPRESLLEDLVGILLPSSH